ncbi:hypothetical protein E2562_014531 [Oryza meyeriana var. granulata]|uniref:Uncharacterized protein n=1 Tax=Oryza meyeriana var. granulata TaxID=110450 RepID=A0A6G1EIU7_9ORYZ|nr:hypothetical protein E2562_014531 [Oryza meyeriana var. granulata]
MPWPPLFSLGPASSSEKPRRNIDASGCATHASMTTILIGYGVCARLTDGQVEVLAGSMNVFMLVSIPAAG